MRAVALFALVLLGVNALPEVPHLRSERQMRIVTDQVIEDIENISQAIRDMGLDPLLIEQDTYKYELPVPVIFNAVAEVEDIRSFGLSDIVVENMNLNILQSRLDFRIVLPHVHFFARKAKGVVTLFDETLTAEGNGSVDVRNIDAVGHASFLLGLISGISVSYVDIDLKIEQIVSNIQLAIQDENYSAEINDFINNQIPATLDEFSDEVNELVALIVFDIITDHYL